MDEKNLVLDLSNLQKTKISVKNGDDIRDLYLNLSDLNIITRFKEKYSTLQELESKAFSSMATSSDDDIEKLLSLGDTLKEIDTEMRNCIDYIFDSNVSEVCAPFGSMYDIVDGEMRCEHIVGAVSGLYESNIQAETKKLESRLKKHTDKYVKK